jgi:peroxiredoxin
MQKPPAPPLDEQVDESIRESFPASDSPAVHPDDEPPGNAQALWQTAAAAESAAHPAGKPTMIPLPPGTPAPAFSLPSSPSKSTALADYLGRPVVLVFYPADRSPVCGDQLALYTELQDEFTRLGAQVLGISVDGPWCHAAFTAARRYSIPLLADFEPKGAVARSYGVYAEQGGTSERALFVIDAKGIVRWSYVSPIAVNPGADGILAALESLQGDQP